MSKRTTGRIPKLSRGAIITRFILLLCGVAILIAGGYALGRMLEGRQYKAETVRGDLAQRFEEKAPIVYKGESYVHKDGMQTFLFMGVDKPQDSVAEAGNYRNGGQADFLLLMIVDNESKRVMQWQIDRDTMAEITTLGVLGHVSGTRLAQICLSHGFGDGKAQSCQLTVDAVQRLLYGIPIDFYVSIPFDAIAALNDVVGGVTVTIEDDMTGLDAAMRQGETITLQGQQAEIFVRSRMSVGDGSNESRMRRQRAYMLGLMQRIDTMISGNPNAVGTLLDALGDAMITDMKRGRMVNEVNKVSEYQRDAVVTLPGEHTKGELGFVEFYVDAEAVENLVINTFYQKQI